MIYSCLHELSSLWKNLTPTGQLPHEHTEPLRKADFFPLHLLDVPKAVLVVCGRRESSEAVKGNT